MNKYNIYIIYIVYIQTINILIMNRLFSKIEI